MSGVAVLRDSVASGRLTLASCSEEKVVRVFDAPRACLDTLLALGAELRGRDFENVKWARDVSSAHEARALGASLPALGLSNRAIFADQTPAADATRDALVGADAYDQGPDDAPDPAAPAAVAEPPLEEHLAQHALWPESHKLYGHGNEVHCVAGRAQRREENGEADEKYPTLFASSSRALAPSAAHVWLWDADRACAAGKAAAHALTPTCLAFSPDGRWLASGGRDRAVCLFGVSEGAEGSDALRLACKVERAHARVVWDVAWSPPLRMAGNGETVFLLATASRDGAVKLWTVRATSSSEGGSSRSSPALEPLASHAHACSVNALAFMPRSEAMPSLCLALGCEDGRVVLLAVCPASGACERLGEGARHAAAVRRVAWRKRSTQGWDLASAGDDHAVRFSCVRDA
ncbi:hypothetical protein H632_c1609p1 [Helicosporidium sp. ATCC 50920]|nr:hypothetical protein H632_c1609p1 [Helicosporidium sp. ATCC 50920]|eukprot:KDD74060.1 hypothetical protein H632_c1609p1 [Helicosporidium sp. ATCC 50920]